MERSPRRLLLALLGVVVFANVTILPAASNQLMREEPVAGASQALLILKSDNFSDTEATITSLETVGAHACHVIPPRVIIATVPTAAEGRVRALANLAQFHRDTVMTGQDATDADIVTGVNAWNSLLAPQLNVSEKELTPLVGDAFEPPVPLHNKQMAEMLTAQSASPDYYQTSEFMIGKVGVGVILPESIGGTENWSTARQNEVFNQIVSGLNWWVTKGGDIAHLTFYYEKQFSVPTQYEPINRNGQDDEDIWVTDIFQNMGYTSGSRFTRAWAYVNDLRQRLHTDWAYTFIVVDSLNDPDGIFANGTYFAWTYYGGPYVVMNYDNDGYGISQMHLVASHETGHVFLAKDEYCQPGYFCCDYSPCGYLHIPNGNCESANPSSVPCMMRWVEDSVCQYTRDQVGWRDSDGDGKADPIDNVITNTMDEHITPAFETMLTFTGATQDIPYVPPVRTAVTINKITTVKFRIDGGAWADGSAVDGAFDSDIENYTFTTPPLEVGTHHIESQAYSSSGNTSAILEQDVDVQAVYTVTITASAGPNGALSPSGTFTMDSGQSQLFTATPNASYIVDKWYLDGNDVQTGGTAYALNYILSDHTVYVTFKIPQITASAGPNGTIIPSGTFTVDAGQSLQFTAEPDTGYTVNTWYLDGNPIQTGGLTYTLDNIQASHTVSVTFWLSITASAGPNGSISPSGAFEVGYGQSQQFTAAPDTGYAVDEWYLDDNPVQTGGFTYMLNDIQASHTVSVTFIQQFIINASMWPNGNINPIGDIAVGYGHSLTFTATPDAGYTVGTWNLDGNPVQTGGTTYTLSNIQANHNVGVTFVLACNIAASAGPNGSINPSGTVIVGYGQNQQFTAAPNEGFALDTWYLDGSPVQTGGSTYILDNIQTGHTVLVTFTLSITASAGPNGTISPNGTFNVNYGQSQSFTATPDAGYTAGTWYLDGNSVQTGGSVYTLHNIQANHSVYVAFRLPTTIFVDVNNITGPWDGSVEHPYLHIQDGIDNAASEDSVIVAGGLYRYAGNVDIDFSGKAITLRSVNGAASCIIDCNGTVSSPHRGFYFHSSEDNNSVIDGFTVINGCDDPGSDFGSGVLCDGTSPTIRNCIFRNNSGIVGGIYSRNANPLITGCVISYNNCPDGIGSIFCDGGGSLITNSVISNNSGYCGGILTMGSNTSIINCTIVKNAGTVDLAGGIYFDSGSMTMTNSIIWDNAPVEIISWSSSSAVNYCDLHPDTDANYLSLGERVLFTDPLFAEPNSGDYHLRRGSPCINAGDPNFSAEPNSVDIDGQPRVIGSRVDIGADEFACAGDLDFSSRVNFSDFDFIKERWLQPDCLVSNRWCEGADFNHDSTVNFLDVALLARHWLEGVTP